MPLRNRVTAFWSVIIAALGVAIIVRTIVAGGTGPTWGLLLGVMFVAVGIGRFWMARKGL